MGLFSMFKSDTPVEMTPPMAFASSMLYCMAADGEMDQEEIAHLVSIIGADIGRVVDPRRLIDESFKYVRRTPVEQFLAEVAPKLSREQKICILLNMIDSIMADGQAEQAEQQLFSRFMQAFGIPEQEFQGHFSVLIAKNNRAIFTR